MGSLKECVLVTGAAGFIGFHLTKRLLDRGNRVIGLDNLNDYYDVRLKEARLAQLLPHQQFQFAKLDLSDRGAEIEESGAAVGEADQHEAAASQVSGGRMGDGQREAHCHRD